MAQNQAGWRHEYDQCITLRLMLKDDCPDVAAVCTQPVRGLAAEKIPDSLQAGAV